MVKVWELGKGKISITLVWKFFSRARVQVFMSFVFGFIFIWSSVMTMMD